MNIYGRMARISRPKISGIGRHEGVLLPTGHVAHTTLKKGAHVCTFDQFKAARPIKIEHELHPLMHQQALQRLQNLLTKQTPYDPILNNCEIFSRTILHEEPQSPQVGFWAVAALFAALWLGVAR